MIRHKCRASTVVPTVAAGADEVGAREHRAGEILVSAGHAAVDDRDRTPAPLVDAHAPGKPTRRGPTGRSGTGHPGRGPAPASRRSRPGRARHPATEATRPQQARAVSDDLQARAVGNDGVHGDGAVAALAGSAIGTEIPSVASAASAHNRPRPASARRPMPQASARSVVVWRELATFRSLSGDGSVCVGADLTERVGDRGTQSPRRRRAEVGDDPGTGPPDLLEHQHDPRLTLSAPLAVVAQRHRPRDRRTLLVARGVVVSCIVDGSAHACSRVGGRVLSAGARGRTRPGRGDR